MSGEVRANPNVISKRIRNIICDCRRRDFSENVIIVYPWFMVQPDDPEMRLLYVYFIYNIYLIYVPSLLKVITTSTHPPETDQPISIKK